MSDLKPCPFCGSSDVETVHCDEVCNVCCENCEAGYWTGDAKDAEATWNNRVSPWRSLKDDPPEPRQLPEYVIRKRGVTKGVYLLGLLWSDGHTWTMVDGEDTPGPGPLEISLDTLIHEGFTEWMEIPA